MRRLILTFGIVLWTTTAQAQFTLIGQDYEECGTAATTCTFGTGVSANAGDLVVVTITSRDLVDISSVSDGVNTGYTCPDGMDFQQGADVRGHVCYYINSGAGTVTPVVTWGSINRGYGSFQVWRPTGTVTLDQTVESGNAAGTSHVTSTLSTGANAALVICSHAFNSSSSTSTAGAGYTDLTDGATRWAGSYDITSVASGSFTCDMTTSASPVSASIGVSFNDSGGGGGGGSSSRGLLLGVGK